MKVKVADPPQNKRMARQKQVNSEFESEKNVEGTRKSRSKQGTAKSNDESENKLNETQQHVTSTENSSESENKINKRQTKRKDGNSKCNSENKNGIENKVDNAIRRGRKSMDTEISVKPEKGGRVTRTSLPAVFENIKTEISQKSEQLTDSKSGSGGNESVVKEKGKGKTKLKGKSIILGKEETKKEIVHTSRTSRNSQEVAENVHVKEEVSDHRRTGRYAKNVVETKKSQLKESKSDITNNATTDNDKQNSSSRSQRGKRNEEKGEPLKDTTEIEIGKKRRLDDVKTGGEKMEPSSQKVSRTRTSRNKAEENHVSEVEPVSLIGEVKHIENKIGAKRKANVIKTETELDTEAAQSSEDISDKTSGSARGRKRGAIKAVSKAKSVTEKEPKEEATTVKETSTKMSGRLKRKESASSSNDSQEVCKK